MIVIEEATEQFGIGVVEVTGGVAAMAADGPAPFGDAAGVPLIARGLARMTAAVAAGGMALASVAGIDFRAAEEQNAANAASLPVIKMAQWGKTFFEMWDADGEMSRAFHLKRLADAQGGRPCPGQRKNLLQSPFDPFENTGVLADMTEQEVRDFYLKYPGWLVGGLGKGRRQGQGLTVRQLAPNGVDVTDLYIQYSPGSRRHFNGDPYWKISGGKIGTTRYRALR